LQPHYAAPFACLFVALMLQGLRALRTVLRTGWPSGRLLVRILLLFYVELVVLRWSYRPAVDTWHLHRPWGRDRADVARLLSARGGKHLVMVRYGEHHDPAEEWVYNRADIDRSSVVWARDMGPLRNEELTEYFMDRTLWLLEPDADPARLSQWRAVSRER
jgi:hypothetical protein